jgi:hypothetical protein
MGPYGIAMVITEALQQYQDILSIGLSSMNFVISLQSPDIQLTALSSPTIEDPDVVLDMVPWCSEYVTFDLPWIIRHSSEGIQQSSFLVYAYNFCYLSYAMIFFKYHPTLLTAVTSLRQPKIYKCNLIGHGPTLQHHISCLIVGEQYATSTLGTYYKQAIILYLT